MTEMPLQNISRQTFVNTSLRSLDDFYYDKKLGIYIGPSGIEAGQKEYTGGIFRNIKIQPSGEPLEFLKNNILEGVSELFDKNSHVLEIGDDHGIGAQWLGERFRQVDAFEGDLLSAVSARKMASKLDNVKVYFGDILQTEFPQNYDLITITGSLEKILFYMGDDQGASCVHLLTRLGRSLSDRGILLLAIENKPGIKDLSSMDSIPEISRAGFGRNDLESMLMEAGFNNTRFYHVFPDHRAARTMIAESDEVLALRPYSWIKMPARDLEYSIPGPVFLKTATDSGLLWQLSNSFLVLAARSESINLKAEWLIKKLNNESYDKKFHHSITLEKNGSSKYVIKRAPILDGDLFFDDSNVEYRLESGKYVEGELLSFSLYSALMSRDQGPAIERVVKTLYQSLMSKYDTGEKDVDGYPLVSGEAIDYTFWNLVSAEGGELLFIDKKWKIKKDIPADLILFRNLFYAYPTVGPFLNERDRLKFITRNIRSIYPRYSLSRLRYDVRLEEKFQSDICGRSVCIGMDGPAGTAINRLSIVFQRLKALLGKHTYV